MSLWRAEVVPPQPSIDPRPKPPANMSNPGGPKPKRIPSWQLPKTPLSPEISSPGEPEDSVAPDERQSLFDNAAKFLEDEDIRDAPIERKKTFLGSKGLTEDEIQMLLQSHDQEQHTPEAEVMDDYGIEKEVLQLQASNPTPDPIKKSTVPTGTDTQATNSAPSSSEGGQPSLTKDSPPIITYPEFLLHSQKPPPLMTAHGLMTTLYVASGMAATAYGTSKYIVEPMIETLTSARHSLAETARSNVETLNSKLESVISKMPDSLIDRHAEQESDNESIDSDPSRFFNRSAGTQTSPRVSRSRSSTQSDSSTPNAGSQSHESASLAIHSRLSDLQSAETANPVQESINDLKKFLDDLPQSSAKQDTGKLWEKSKPDGYGKLKAEIRGVKGVLLSARNFPSSVPVR